jgi:hypothetical protein
MAYNGSGTFVVNSAGQPVVTGTVISSTAFNALTADLATGLSTAITKDGQTTTTARILFAQGVSSTLTTDATSATTGSILTAGGISMQKALWVGTTTTLAGALTYGGVTLSNAVTGTGNMVLSASPTLTGTVTGASCTWSGNVYIGGTSDQGYGPGAQKLQVNSSAVLYGASATPRTFWFGEAGVNTGARTIGSIGYATGVTSGSVLDFIVTSGADTAAAAKFNYNVGIGMTPSNVLDITQNQASNSYGNLLNSTSTGAAYWRTTNGTYESRFGIVGTAGAFGAFANSDTVIYGSSAISIATAGAIKFDPGNGGEAARFGTNGYLGIGTTSPSQPLHVAKSTDAVILLASTTAGYASMFAQSANGAGLFGTNSNYPLTFYTNTTEVARFDTSGNLLVGQTSVSTPTGSNYIAVKGRAYINGGGVGGSSAGAVINATNGTDSAALFTTVNNTTNSGQIWFINNNGQVGSVTTNGSSTAFNTSSDLRLKCNVCDAGDAGEIIDQLKVRSWDWKIDGSHEAFGFVAQEEYAVYPKAVSAGDDDPENIKNVWARDDSKLVPMLIKEVQSLRTRLAALENK